MLTKKLAKSDLLKNYVAMGDEDYIDSGLPLD
jgi:hypothetical protein